MRIWLYLALCGWSATSVFAQAQPDALSASDRQFVEEIYPQLRAVQCHLCHNDNGVASDYELHFPAANASRDQVLAFGYQLADFVDQTALDNSSLLLKPTGRIEHTGGVRIKPDSMPERALKAWIKHLSSLSNEEQARAKRLIENARQWQREPLSLQRLTHSQYNNTVRDLLGDQSQPANQFPKKISFAASRINWMGRASHHCKPKPMAWPPSDWLAMHFEAAISVNYCPSSPVRPLIRRPRLLLSNSLVYELFDDRYPKSNWPSTRSC